MNKLAALAALCALGLTGCGLALPGDQRREQIKLLRQIRDDTHAMCFRDGACDTP